MAQGNKPTLEQMEEDAAAALERHADTKTLDLMAQAIRLQDEIEDMQRSLKDKSKELRDIMEHTLPARAQELGMPELSFTKPDKTTVRFVQEVRIVGSLNSAPDQEEAVKYLEAEGFQGAIQTYVMSAFTEQERDIAKALQERTGQILSEHQLPDRDVILKREINAQTLMAFGRARSADNPDFDFEKVGLFAHTRMKFAK